MNTAELRINNWININGVPFQLELPDLNLIANKNGKSNYEPIPLNEEWLLKAGFEHVLNEHTNADFWQIKRKKNDYRPHITIYKNRITVGNNTGVKYFNDVHSLQNLYFALSGEELTIK